MSFIEGLGFSGVAMTIVFIMLIALALVIVFMGKMLGEKPAPKKELVAEKTEEIQEEYVEEYVEEIPVVDDCEIVAVIMAALSASLNVPSDKLTIRSIKRTNNWRR